jgi:hypothetical protein
LKALIDRELGAEFRERLVEYVLHHSAKIEAEEADQVRKILFGDPDAKDAPGGIMRYQIRD